MRLAFCMYMYALGDQIPRAQKMWHVSIFYAKYYQYSIYASEVYLSHLSPLQSGDLSASKNLPRLTFCL